MASHSDGSLTSVNLTFYGIELFRESGLNGDRQMVVNKKDIIKVSSIPLKEGSCQHCGSKHPAGRVAQFTYNGRLTFSKMHTDGDAAAVTASITDILHSKEFIEALNTDIQDYITGA